MQNPSVVGIICQTQDVNTYVQDASARGRNHIAFVDEADISHEAISQIRQALDGDGQLLVIVDSTLALNKSNVPEFLQVSWQSKV